ncbi:hypothetical protein KAR91_68915 [Candidatus Pacearchaeota archaeon]|nr:hypothetical protein [Candidatus Pacearchaeota archaeon]
MSAKNQNSFFIRPETEKEVSELSEKVLKKADAYGVLPTPIDEIIEAEKISSVDDMEALEDGFLSKLTRKSRDTFKSMIQKVRGIADLREKVNYVPKADNHVRSRFPKAHELGHQVMPWHTVDPVYVDDKHTLSPDIEDEFDREANFFASEILFQGKLFRTEARDYKPSFPAIFKLADRYGTSIQSTIWRYVEEQDEKIAVAQFYPGRAIDNEGNPVLRLWKVVCSPRFFKKFGGINIPSPIRTGHDWVAARELDVVCDGNGIFNCEGSDCPLEWYSFWNGYTLIVLLRETPTFGVIGRILK